MTTRKRVISIISIISLILAITAGVLLSVAVQPKNNYVGDSVRLSNTDVTINAQTSTKSSATSDGVPEDAPDDAVAISTLDELKSFIRGNEAYGYLANNIEDTLDWEGIGAQTVFSAERTLNGNGYSIKLADTTSTTTGNNGSTSGYAEGFVDPLETNSSIAGVAIRRSYGMLVDYNLGTIKNVKFIYNSTSATIKNNDQDGSSGDKTMYANFVGIVCGTNTGRIENCDLDVSGAFTYNYENGKIGDDSDNRNNRFDTMWGGIAGRNGGVIKNITAQYSNFTLNLYTKAQNTKTGNLFSHKPTSAKSCAGGIAGRNALSTAEVSNIIILGSDVKFALSSDGVKAYTTNPEVFREYGAVVCGNSAYSHGVGDTADKQAKVDNIIVDFEVTGSFTMGSKMSRNAVVFCGKSTNVTILRVSDTVSENQHIDYQTDHCNCGVSGNGGQHEAGYGNLIHTGDYSNVTVGFDDEGNQVITVEPKDKERSILGEVAFTKYEKRGTVTDGSLEPGVEDTATYTGVASNGSTYLYNQVDVRQDKYTFTVRPYQAVSSKYWEIGAYSYQIATISNAGAAEYTYTGEDFLLNQFSYATLAGDKNGVVNPKGLNARTSDGKAVTSGRLPGEYEFVLAEKEAGLSYIDTENQIVAFAEETPTPYSFKVNLAQITPLDASLIGENWMTVQQDFTFELAGGIEGAADGYQYEVGGSLPTPVTGLVMQNRQDTGSAGRTYKIELTSGGVVVTQPYTYTVKIDLTAPTAEIIHYEHPADRYYTHNKITIEATDKASGVASIVMNSYDANNQLDHSHNIMTEGTDNGDGTYTWGFQDTGRKEIVVTDYAGHTSTIEVNVKIDTVQPTLTVDAYYFVDETIESGSDLDGNPIYTTVQKKMPYTNDTEGVTSAVYFEANATFGESGGEIRYSLDNGSTWEVYDGIVTVKLEKYVKFRAVSNTYDHPEDDVYPYPNRYPLVDNWDNQTMHVVIDLPKVVITLEDLVIDNATKTFDGTNTFLGNVTVKEGFEAENNINGEVQITSVVYADVNASESVALEVSVFCTDDTKLMDNQIEGAVGSIEKKVIDVTIDGKTKIYGVSLPQLTYKQSGMIEGFEENVNIYVQKPDGYTGSYELLPQTADGEGYVIAIADGTTFVNYTLGTVTEGRLKVTLAPVDRLVYERGQFTGLDLNNIADRNLEIGFIRSNGNYEKLDVTYYAHEYYFDSSNNSFVDNGYTKKVDDITKAGAGFFKVVISLPEYDANGELLTNKYVMDEDITEFMIKIIDSTIFDVEEEPEPSEPADDKTEQETPVVNNGANGQVGIYEDNSANTDSTDIGIESTQQKRDYIAMISIFCAVAITIAFAIGVSRAIAKRIRR